MHFGETVFVSSDSKALSLEKKKKKVVIWEIYPEGWK